MRDTNITVVGPPNPAKSRHGFIAIIEGAFASFRRCHRISAFLNYRSTAAIADVDIKQGSTRSLPSRAVQYTSSSTATAYNRSAAAAASNDEHVHLCQC